MLPILRILPVGGVLLAILVLVLALSPPDASRSPLAAAIAPARGALVDRDRHPEVRQFLILAALKASKELKSASRIAGNSDALQHPASRGPAERRAPTTDPDETGTITETPGVTIPVEIGEPSSTELPITLQGEDAPEVKNPGAHPNCKERTGGARYIGRITRGRRQTLRGRSSICWKFCLGESRTTNLYTAPGRPVSRINSLHTPRRKRPMPPRRESVDLIDDAARDAVLAAG